MTLHKTLYRNAFRVNILTDEDGNIRLVGKFGSRVLVDVTVLDPEDGPGVCRLVSSRTGINAGRIEFYCLRVLGIG